MSSSKKGVHKLKKKNNDNSPDIVSSTDTSKKEQAATKKAITDTTDTEINNVQSDNTEPVFSTDLLPVKKRRGRKPNPKKTIDEVKKLDKNCPLTI